MYLTALRAICVASCIITGVYCLILFRYYKGWRRTLWFPVLCFSLALNARQNLALAPYHIFEGLSEFTISDNLFLCSFNLSSLAMNLYNGTNIYGERSKFYKAYNYVCLIFAVFCLGSPAKIGSVIFAISGVFSFMAYIYGLYASYRMYNNVSKTYIYALFSYILMIVTFVPSMILLSLGYDFPSFRITMVPIYLILHTVMLTIQYRNSIIRTKKLSESLAQTIEKIEHSDNALQCTQLKSDFLFSTLDMIKERCDSDSFTAEELTISLSKFLRHTLNFQQLKGIVPLSNELELSRAYIAIEKERYPEVTFDIKLPLELPDVYVPPLSIQPLIENAIEHGIDKKKGGKITVKISSYKDYCQIDVSDNGKGMPEEELSGLPDSFPHTARIGLYSINKRLIERFGRGLVIQSAPEVGTSVSFMIPPEGKYDGMEKAEVTV